MINDHPFTFESQVETVKKSLDEIEDYQIYTLNQKEKILEKRITKYYAYGLKINMKDEHFKSRIQPIYTENVYTLDNSVVLFGIDFIKNKDIKKMFEEFQPFTFTCINESNCMLTFKNAITAKEAIKGRVRKQSKTSFKVEEDEEFENTEMIINQEGINLTFNNNHNTQNNISNGGNLPRQWIELQPYTYKHQSGQFQRKLYVRYATSSEYNLTSDQPIVEIYKKAKHLWNNDQRQTAEFKALMQKKVLEIKHKIDSARKIKERQNQFITSQEIKGEKSRTPLEPRNRSRDMKKMMVSGGKMTQLLDKLNNEQHIEAYENSQSNFLDRDPELSMEIRSRSENSEINEVIQQFANLNFDSKDPQEQHLSMQFGKLNFSDGPQNNRSHQNLSFRKNPVDPSQIAYKICGMKQQSNNGKWNYRDYVEQQEMRKCELTSAMIDLCDE